MELNVLWAQSPSFGGSSHFAMSLSADDRTKSRGYGLNVDHLPLLADDLVRRWKLRQRVYTERAPIVYSL
jgi:hypothetical protein